MDDTTTVAALRRAVHDFVNARDWYRHHTPKNLAMSIAIESAELMEHFQWLTARSEPAAGRRAQPAPRLPTNWPTC